MARIATGVAGAGLGIGGLLLASPGTGTMTGGGKGTQLASAALGVACVFGGAAILATVFGKAEGFEINSDHNEMLGDIAPGTNELFNL